MINPIGETLRWHASLYKKVLSLAFHNTIQGASFTTASRICYLVSFLLPLKAILFTGASLPPDFILQLYPSITIRDLVLLLVILTIIFYLGSIYFQNVVEKQLERGAKKITGRTRKVGANIDVPVETERAYNDIIKSLSSFLFFFVILIVLVTLNSKLAMGFAAVVIIPWVVIVLAWKHMNELLQNWLSANRRLLQRRWVFCVFMTVFILIILEALNNSENFSVLFSVILLILSRYALSAANDFANTAFSLSSRKEKVNKVLFFNFLKMGTSFPARNSANTIPTSEGAHKLATSLIQSLEAVPAVPVLIWKPIDISGVFCFELYGVDRETGKDGDDPDYIFKIYQRKFGLAAQHERLLLENTPSSVLPAPRLLATDVFDGFEGTLLEWPGVPVTTKAKYEQGVVSVLRDMWSVESSKMVLSSYTRSHECSIEKLDSYQLQGLTLVSTDESMLEAVSELIEQLDTIKKYVLTLPLTLHNPELKMGVMSTAKDQRTIVSHWGKWSVEPIGAALCFFDFLNHSDINHILEQVKTRRPDCRYLQTDQLWLSGELYKLWALIKDQKFPDALPITCKVLDLYRGLAPAS